jgi:hypothetical protein
MSLNNLVLAAVLLVSSFAAAGAPKKAASGAEPADSKTMLGLDLKPVGAWKPAWDPDAKVAKWENDEFMSSIVIRIVNDKLDTIEDLKKAAPMMMQLGTEVTKVVEAPKSTDKGWYAVVDGDGTSNFVYVQKYGAKTVVCSASVKSGMGPSISKGDALKACDSIKVK